MSLSEFERRAWDSRTTSDKHAPAMALKAALDDIERGEIKPRHVMVVIVEVDADGDDCVGTYQAGDLSTLACEGAFGRAIRLMSES